VHFFADWSAVPLPLTGVGNALSVMWIRSPPKRAKSLTSQVCDVQKCATGRLTCNNGWIRLQKSHSHIVPPAVSVCTRLQKVLNFSARRSNTACGISDLCATNAYPRNPWGYKRACSDEGALRRQEKNGAHSTRSPCLAGEQEKRRRLGRTKEERLCKEVRKHPIPTQTCVHLYWHRGFRRAVDFL